MNPVPGEQPLQMQEPAVEVRPSAHGWQVPPETENWLAAQLVQLVEPGVADVPHGQLVHDGAALVLE